MTPTNYDSEFCGKVPIHLTNLIQPYGVLLVVDTNNFKVIQVSDNAASVFGIAVAELVTHNLAELIGEEAFAALHLKLVSSSKKIPSVWMIQGKHYLALVHNKETHLLIEIEIDAISLSGRDSFIEVYHELKHAMHTIGGTTTLQQACEVAASEIKRISGFDKVMIYRFEEDWNGTVTAEEREEDMEAYLGFTFPASDIPKQARDLYLKNPYRLIPDKDYVPVKLFPVINPMTHSFIDLSDCNLRSVVAVHIEYLGNMGVTASMSTRILYQDKLWGLIACHHKAPKFLSYEMCSIFEMLSTVISAKLSFIQNEEALVFKNTLGAGYSRLLENIYRSNGVDQSLLGEGGISRIFDATGVAIARNGRFSTVGTTPTTDQLEELLLWLHTLRLREVFHTDKLSELHDYAAEYQNEASGLLVIPIDYEKDNYVMIFRAEKVRTINWGGDPDKRITFEKDEKNYHPRSSFKQWQQHVSGMSIPWRAEELEYAEALRNFIHEYETSTYKNER